MEQPTADEVRDRMARVRADLRHSAAQLREDAQSLADWRYYVRRYPWISAAAAGAVGYLIVPRRKEQVTPDPKALAEWARQQRLVVQPQERPAASSGLISSLTSTLGRTLLRSALAYAGQHFGQVLAAKMANAPPGQNGHSESHVKPR